MNENIFIFGSCVSRDIFAFTKTDEWVSEYIARQSIVSTVSAPLPVALEDIHLKSKWQSRMVHSDFCKTFPRILEETAPWYLLIDLIDERFGLMRSADRIITASGAFSESGLDQKFPFQKIAQGIKRSIWRDACGRFIDLIAPYLDKRAVILHPAFWAEEYLDNGELHRFEHDTVRYNNDYLNEFYTVFQQYAGKKLIVLPRVKAIADAQHKWGLAPFHYTQNYYSDRLAQLKEVMETQPDAFDLERPANPEKLYAESGKSEIVDFAQKIADGHLCCAVTASYPSTALYMYNILYRGSRIDQVCVNSAAPISYPLKKEGFYAIGCVIKTAQGETLLKSFPPLFFARAELDVMSGADVAAQMGGVNSFTVKNRLSPDRVDSPAPGAHGRLLYVDFIRACDAYLAQNLETVRALRYLSISDQGVDAPVPEPTRAAALEAFRAEIRRIIDKAAAYGADNLIFAFPLFDWQTATEEELNLNWLMEECCALAREIDGAQVLLCLDGLVQRGGAYFLKPKFIAKLDELIGRTAEARALGIDYFSVSAKITGNELFAQIDIAQVHEDYKYSFYLVREGTVLERTKHSQEPTYRWTLSEPGIYMVQGYVRCMGKSVFYRSNTVEYFTEADEAEYRAFLADDAVPAKLIGQKCRLFGFAYPYFNFVLCDTHKNTALDVEGGIRAFLSEHADYKSEALFAFPAHQGTVLTNADHVTWQNGAEKLIFSGVTLVNGRHIVGFRDLKSCEDVRALHGALGAFTALHVDGEKCAVLRDYLGQNAVYYYRTENDILVSNSYHMLLEFIKALKIRLTFDLDKACVTLSAVRVQMLRQNFSFQMDMREIRQLPNHLDMFLTDQGIELTESPYGRAIARREPYHEEQYRSLLRAAQNEMTANVQAIMRDPRYRYVTCDLTGGLDSRVIFSMITSLPPYEKPIAIRSEPPMSDLELAIRLNSMYGYDWTTAPAFEETGDPEEMDMDDRSVRIGTYSNDVNPNHSVMALNNQEISLNGSSGEVLARPHVARWFLAAPRNATESVAPFVRYVAQNISPYILTDDEKAFAPFRAYMNDALSEITARSVFEKINRHYLEFRNTYHFNPAMTYVRGRASWAPMQSKVLLRLHHMTFDVFLNIRLEVDMIYQMNPMLLTVPFEDAEDRREFEAIEDTLFARDQHVKTWRHEIKGDMSAWQQAKNEKQANRVNVLSGDERSEMNRRYNALPEVVYASLQYNFRQLMRACPVLSDRIGLAIYRFIKNKKNNKGEINVMYQKVTSLLDQIRIFPPEDRE